MTNEKLEFERIYNEFMSTPVCSPELLFSEEKKIEFK